MSTKFNVIDLFIKTGALVEGVATYEEEMDIDNTTSAFAESAEPITEFDTFELAEIPTMVLCNPNKEPLYALGGVSDRKYKPRFNQLDELTFRADRYIDENEMPYFDYLVSKRLVYLGDNLGYFKITKVKEDGDGIKEYKNITCHSLEVEFATRNLNFFKYNSIQFYNAVRPEGTLLGKIMEYMPDWSVGKVNGAFASKYRSFTITANKSIYNFLLNDVSQAYECIFQFDTINKTISAVGVDDATTPTDIYVSYDNLIKKIEIEESTEELVTALSVFGGNGLDINDVNPLGTNTIYDFTYFKGLDSSGSPLWMSQDLVNAITDWETLVSGSQVEFAELVTDVKEGYSIIGDLQAELSASRTILEGKEVELAALIRGGLPTTAIKEQIVELEQLISSGSTVITLWQNTVSGSIADMSEISEGLALDNPNNFTVEQQKNLQPFIIEGSYINENIIQTDIMSASAVQEQSQSLYEQGQNTLTRVSEPRYTFSIDSINFLQLIEFKTFIRQLQLGALINLELDENTIVNPILLGIDIDFDNPENFKLIFGNRLKLDDEALQFSDLMDDAANAATATKVNSLLWSNWDDNYKDEVSDFISSALDAAVNNVTSGSNQDIIINKSGLRGRQSDGSGGYLDEQVWLVNNTLAFTDDNWDTAKIAIGEIFGPDGQSVWGIVAEYIVGEFIVGGDLLILNEDSTFAVSGSQAVLTNSDFVINSTSASTVIRMNPWDGITISDASGSALWIDTHGNLTIGGEVNILGMEWDNINNKPDLIMDGVPYYFDPPPGDWTGLFISGNYLGYVSNGEWTSYLDSNGNFVLGNPEEEDGYGMYWNQESGNMVISGSIVARGGRITGDLEMSSELSAISIGNPETPDRLDEPYGNDPSFSGTGIWMDRSGFYSLNNGIIEVEIDSENGVLYAGGGDIEIDRDGISVTGLRDGITFYDGDVIGSLMSARRENEEYLSLRRLSLESSANLVNGTFEDYVSQSVPTGWNRIVPDTTYGTVIKEWQYHFIHKYSGDYSMGGGVSAYNNNNPIEYAVQSDAIYHEPGDTFSAQAYVTCIQEGWDMNITNEQVTETIYMYLDSYNASNSRINTYEIGRITNEGWTLISDNDIASVENSEYVRIRFKMSATRLPAADDVGEWVWAAIDNVTFYITNDEGFVSSSIEIFENNINYISDDHYFTGNVHIDGNLTATGTTPGASGDDLIVNNDLTVGNNANINGNLYVGGIKQKFYSRSVIQKIVPNSVNTVTHNLGITSTHNLVVMAMNGDTYANSFVITRVANAGGDKFDFYADGGSPVNGRINFILAIDMYQ